MLLIASLFQVTDCKETSKAMVLFDTWANSEPRMMENQMKNAQMMLPKIHAFRSYGKEDVRKNIVPCESKKMSHSSAEHGAVTHEEALGMV